MNRSHSSSKFNHEILVATMTLLTLVNCSGGDQSASNPSAGGSLQVSGGTQATGGTQSVGGTASTGGKSSTGGTSSTSGTSNAAGATSAGGASAGGTSGVAGAWTGGTTASGGATTMGGTLSTGGSQTCGYCPHYCDQPCSNCHGSQYCQKARVRSELFARWNGTISVGPSWKQPQRCL